MKKDEKIYVAGHKGMVGSAILGKLKELDFKNLVVRTLKELDLTRQKDVEEFFEEERPKYVFIAAAKVGGILANNTYKAEFIYENTIIAANMIHSSYKYGVKKLLNLGSSCIYPKFAPQPLKEEYILTGSLEPTNEPYAIAKISAIKLCRYYNEQYKTNFISVMPTNLYGQNDNFNLETSHVLPALMRKFHLAKLLHAEDFEGIKSDFTVYGNPSEKDIETLTKDDIAKILDNFGITSQNVTLWGSGSPYREFLYVDDLADACIFLMQNCDTKDIGEFINIGTGKDIQIKELAMLIKEIIGFKGEIEWDTSKPDGTPRKLLEISKIESLGWKPITSLLDGIKNIYQWYIEL